MVLISSLISGSDGCKPSTSSSVAANALTKDLVGLVTCATSFWGLISINNNNINGSVVSVGSEYFALSVCAGYLAYSFWHSFLFGIKCSSLAIVEDAVTLTIISVILALSSESLVDYHVWIRRWIVYKTLCFLYSIQSSSWDGHGHTRNGPQHKMPKQQKKQHSEKFTSSSTPASINSLGNEHNKFKTATTKLKKENETWIIHGEKYDLSDYVESHPGGKEAILLGRGRDCTALFESYHPFTSTNRTVLQKYKVYSNCSSEPSNSKLPRDEFYSVLCRRAEETLRRKGIDPNSDRGATPLRVLYYSVIMMALICSAYSHVQGSTVGSFSMAIFGWLIGSLGHDSGHFSTSKAYPWINDVCVWGMSFLCNPIMWQHQHTYGHHSHTNEFDRDPDLHHFHSLIRVHRRFKYQDLYKHQSNWVFVAFAYTFVVFGTCIWIPWGVLETGALYGMTEWTDNYQKRPLRAAGMTLHMVCYVLFIIALPFYTHPSFFMALLAVVGHISTSGMIFALFSQINHLNEPSIVPIDDKERKTAKEQSLAPSSTSSSSVSSSWAAAQVESSNNFATTSTLWHVLSNGLNLQIEHHLFPGLNHCHLHHIAPIVRETCREYNVNYKSYETWNDLMQATLSWLNALSAQDF